jgi:glyoxalase/bleomycin resistance protein/dioxygenase superfamily protein
LLFDRLDFIYSPSADVDADAKYFEEILGARIVFKVDAMGARVAMIELAEGPPRLLLADHLKGERPVLVYEVEDLQQALDRLEAQGWNRESTFEIPQGPCCSFSTPGGHRIALYQLTRPQVEEHFRGRHDF